MSCRPGASDDERAFAVIQTAAREPDRRQSRVHRQTATRRLQDRVRGAVIRDEQHQLEQVVNGE